MISSNHDHSGLGSEEPKIDLNSDFNIDQIRIKAHDKQYSSEDEVINDLQKCITYLSESNTYVIKSFDKITNRYALSYQSKTSIKDMLKSIKLFDKVVNKDSVRGTSCLRTKTITCWDVFDSSANFKLTSKGIKFNSNESRVLSVFQGYDHPTVDKVDMKIIESFLNHVHEIIFDNNDDVYNYFIKWFSLIIQNPGIKTGTSFILKGLQGVGKNVFTDVLCNLLKRYSHNNITNIDELTGKFNSVVENSMLIILNELKNAGQDRNDNFDALKSIITDSTIRINEKNQPRRTAENVANFIFCTNNAYPIKIESSDRRYIVTECSDKYRGNFNYFKILCSSFTPQFYSHLLTYFMNQDLSTFEVRSIPMTESKQDLINASRSSVELFICSSIKKFVKGYECDLAYNSYQKYCSDKKLYVYSEKIFGINVKQYCTRKQIQSNKKRHYYYFLKPQCESLLKFDNEELSEEVEVNESDKIDVSSIL